MSEEELLSNIEERRVYSREDIEYVIGGDILRPTKRPHADSNEKSTEEEGFTLVQRRAKRFAKNNSVVNEKSKDETICVEVCITSKNMLPKQIAFAKLLKVNNIKNVTHIKYKNPYKLLMKLETKEDAENVLKCEKFAELEYRCHLTSEVDLSYGVVKYLELEVKDEEIMESFKCEYQIVSVKRLKRMSETGEWVDSETVRFCFKSSVVPTYVFGYGCRFKVESYTFPVTQCSTCWRYGHLARTCPTRKVLCPKCGGNHPNCETVKYKCLNCKGDHMSFNKICPAFVKEKKIRMIMSQHNCTYKIALAKYIDYNKEINTQGKNEQYGIISQKREQNKSYSDALLAQNRHIELPLCQDNSVEEESEVSESHQSELEFMMQQDIQAESNSMEMNWERSANKSKKKKRKTRGSLPAAASVHGTTKSQNKIRPTAAENDSNSSFMEQFNFNELLMKLKSIIFSSDKSLEEKFMQIVHMCFEAFMSFIVKSVSSGGLVKKLINLFHNG